MRQYLILLSILLLCTASIAEQISKRASNRRVPSQEEADCPSGCRCDRNNIVCRNRNFKSTDVFQQLHPLAFPHLDTLVMTGNRFGDLSGQLFGDGEEHPNLSMINLTDSGITRIDEDTFKHTPNVEYLHLGHNQISSIGKHPFRHLRKLRVLDLTSAFAKRSADSMADLLSLMFDSDHRTYFDLQEIILSNNDLQKVHPDTFCKVEGLARLFLNGNKLTKFEVSSKCLNPLKMIDLGDNQFTTVPASLWDALPNLNGFDISSNPLICDCALQPFVEITRNDPNHFYNQGKTFCASPSAHKGVGLFDIKGDLCKSPSSHTLAYFIILTVIAGAVLFVYRHYRDRIPVPLPFQFGYQNLNTNEENVRPEFV